MEDYNKLGLKCGLEIHQQLDTGKLFCDCPSQLRDDDPHFEVQRKLRAVSGELGVQDRAALAEHKRERSFTYQGYNDTTCLIELDEEPIRPINFEALKVVLQTAKMLNAEVVDEIQCMRKTVIDGSNTSGFQRTCLVARNGTHEIAGISVGFPTICIEEDAARKISENERGVTYRLDRLGIPLIELATTPCINDPEDVRKVAEYIGMILRSTGKVKRGLGTIRQDVNVSIKGGARIEIKGAQDLSMMKTLVENEVQRQKELIKLVEELHGIPGVDLEDSIDVSDHLRSSESKIVKKTLQRGGRALALRLPRLKGILGKEVCQGRRVGSEVSDYAKAGSGVGGIFHFDELPKYGITKENVEQIVSALGNKEQDSFILVCDAPEKAQKAIASAKERIKDLFEKVPEEVRRAKPDGTSMYMRPLAGGHRMYPETDFIPVVPNISGIELPELITHKIRRYQEQYNLSEDLARLCTKSGYDLDSLTRKFSKLKPTFIADTLINKPKELKKRFNLEISIDEHCDEILSRINSGKLNKEALFDVLQRLAQGKQVNYEAYEGISESTLRQEVAQILKNNPGKKPSVIMGIIMGKYRGKIEGKKVMEIINELT